MAQVGEEHAAPAAALPGQRRFLIWRAPVARVEAPQEVAGRVELKHRAHGGVPCVSKGTQDSADKDPAEKGPLACRDAAARSPAPCCGITGRLCRPTPLRTACQLSIENCLWAGGDHAVRLVPASRPHPRGSCCARPPAAPRSSSHRPGRSPGHSAARSCSRQPPQAGSVPASPAAGSPHPPWSPAGVRSSMHTRGVAVQEPGSQLQHAVWPINAASCAAFPV